jgi:hypothetical protein
LEEIWRDVEGYKGYYQVSNLGNVRSLERTITTKRGYEFKCKAKTLQPTKARGYQTLRLRKNQKYKSFLVHRLVAIAFLPNPEGKKEVNHIDGNKENNRLDNLEWATHQENLIHAYANGLTKGPNVNGKMNGEGNGQAKLTEERVKFIRENATLNGGDFPASKLAKMFNVAPRTVYDAIYVRRWKYLK